MCPWSPTGPTYQQYTICVPQRLLVLEAPTLYKSEQSKAFLDENITSLQLARLAPCRILLTSCTR